MKNVSYLLLLDRSSESRIAASFAWTLASLTGASVVAQHVVDSAAVWRFLSFETAGFVGSGIFMEAREQIIKALHTIADALVLSYEALAEGNGFQAETHIDEGDLVTETARRAKEHDLVVFGYKQNSDTHTRMLEQLVEVCPCPIIVVKNAVKRWSKLQIFANGDMPDSTRSANLYPIGSKLGMPVEVYLDEKMRIVDEALKPDGWSTALGVKTIRKGCLKDLLKAAGDDVLIVTPVSALMESKFTRSLMVVKKPPTQTERRMDQSVEGAEDSENGSRLAS
jgi:nucleotide-binding universal stress UspA family protein